MFSLFNILIKNKFQDDKVDSIPWKVASKTKNSLLLTALNQMVLKDIKKSFEDVHLDAKIYWVSPASLWFSTTVIMLVLTSPPWWEMQIDFRCKRAGNRRANMIINSYGNLSRPYLLLKKSAMVDEVFCQVRKSKRSQENVKNEKLIFKEE